MEEKIDMIILNPTAHQKLFIFKPGSMASIIINITALITIRNNPSDKIVIGNVKKTKTGFKSVLATANNTAVKIA